MYTTDIFNLTEDTIIAHYKTAMHHKGLYTIGCHVGSFDYAVLTEYLKLKPMNQDAEHRMVFGLTQNQFAYGVYKMIHVYDTPKGLSAYMQDAVYNLASGMLETIGIELI